MVTRPDPTAPVLAVVDGAADPTAADRALVQRFRRGDPGAPAALFDRYGTYVNRVLLRLLGGGSDHDDRVQDAFVEILRSVHTLRDEGALRPWITTVTVRIARGELRKRKLRRMFFLDRDEDPPEPPVDDDHPARAALRSTWKVLEAMPVDERLAFTLRFLHGDELVEVASACGCSLATIKRRLARAEARFVTLARRDPLLAARIEKGERWKESDEA